MKELIDKMEQERDEMIAEVEAQIEKALASMAIEVDESDYVSSRPNSRLSSTSRPSKSRRPSDATPKTRPLRSIGTDSTLAESYGNNDVEAVNGDTSHGDPQTQDEGSEGKPNKKRFSASQVDVFQDSMNAVDEGISLKSDNIAQKVLEIEQKVSAHRADRKEVTYEFLSLRLHLPLNIGQAREKLTPLYQNEVRRNLLRPSGLVPARRRLRVSPPSTQRRVEREVEQPRQRKLAPVSQLMRELLFTVAPPPASHQSPEPIHQALTLAVTNRPLQNRRPNKSNLHSYFTRTLDLLLPLSR